MQLDTNITCALNHPLSLPSNDTIYHPDLLCWLEEYANKQEIIHTLFHGPAGSGKTRLVRQMISKHKGVPYDTVAKIQSYTVQFKDRDYPFYKSPFHFELNVSDFSPHRQNILMEFLNDLAKTRNVSQGCYKIIVLRNVEILHRGTQHQLRRMLELFYSTCRIIFICHSIDRLDLTLQSRFVIVRVPYPKPSIINDLKDKSNTSPSLDAWLSSLMTQNALPDIMEVSCSQLWLVMQKKKIPIAAFRKWIRIATMTHLPLVSIIKNLCSKVIKQYPESVQMHVKMFSMVNNCMHMYAVGRNKEFQPELLLCNMYLMIKAEKKVFSSASNKRSLKLIEQDII